jgi:modulator of FtsH protease HflC
MKTHLLRYATGAVTLFLMLFFAVTYQVREGQQAIVFCFGRARAEVFETGLHAKLPWPIERVEVLDGRARVLNTKHTEMLTRDKKNIILLSYVVWRISDPLRFFQSLGTIEAADAKLDGLVTNAKIGVLGKYDLSALVSTNPDDLQVDLIERDIKQTTEKKARDKYGVEIVEVGFKRLSLPEGNTRYVFEQMRAERKQYAAEYRAKGELEASKIRSETDLKVAIIRAEGKEEAAQIRGKAEAEAARIYADAHSMDPEFYRFMRSLDTLGKVMDKETTVILRTDSEPFDLLQGK